MYSLSHTQMTRGGDKNGNKNKNTESRERMVNKYRVCQKVGEGSFGEVFKVVHTETNTAYAMKVRNPRKNAGTAVSSILTSYTITGHHSIL